jgi:hypothetical protein
LYINWTHVYDRTGRYTERRIAHSPEGKKDGQSVSTKRNRNNKRKVDRGEGKKIRNLKSCKGRK